MTSMATPLAEPYGRPRDYVWRMAGLGRPVLSSMAAATPVSAVAAVAASAWALYETRTADDRVQRWVVWVDGTAAPIGRVPIGQDWSPGPGPGAYVDFAERWIRSLRSRPTDLDTLKLNRRDVIWTTDQRVYGPLQESMKKADEEFRNAAVDVARLAAA